MNESAPPVPSGGAPPARDLGSSSQKVSLGCWTLILIALIVLIFSREGVDNVEKEVQALRKEVAELKQDVQAQTEEIKKLQAQLAPEGRARP